MQYLWFASWLWEGRVLKELSFSLRHCVEKLMDPRVKSYFTPAQSQSISLTLFMLHWNRNLEWQGHYHQRKGKSHHGSSACIVQMTIRARWEQTMEKGTAESSEAQAVQESNHADWIWRYPLRDSHIYNPALSWCLQGVLHRGDAHCFHHLWLTLSILQI